MKASVKSRIEKRQEKKKTVVNYFQIIFITVLRKRNNIYGNKTKNK